MKHQLHHTHEAGKINLGYTVNMTLEMICAWAAQQAVLCGRGPPLFGAKHSYLTAGWFTNRGNHSFWRMFQERSSWFSCFIVNNMVFMMPKISWQGRHLFYSKFDKVLTYLTYFTVKFVAFWGFPVEHMHTCS